MVLDKTQLEHYKLNQSKLIFSEDEVHDNLSIQSFRETNADILDENKNLKLAVSKLHDNLALINLSILNNSSYESIMPGLFESIGFKFGNDKSNINDSNVIK